MNRIATIIVTLLLSLPTVAAPDAAAAAPDLSPEQAVLQRRIGTWETTTTIKPGPWVPQGKEAKSVESIRWILGSFIEGSGREVGSPLVTNQIMGYDATSKTYRAWYFDSAGASAHPAMVGQWDAATTALNFDATLPDEVVFKSELKFVDADHMDWAATWTGKDGTVLMDVQGRQTRRIPSEPGAGGKDVEPSTNAAPDPNGPPELRRYVGFIGHWIAATRDNTVPDPAWNPADGNHTAWTLGGRFIRDEIRNEKGELTLLGIWTYDAQEKTHREWYFLADGNVIESAAIWDETKSTLIIDGKLLRGGTIRGSRRVTGVDAYAWNAVILDEATNKVADLSGRQERLKP